MSGRKTKLVRRVVRREIKKADIYSNRPWYIPKLIWKSFARRIHLVFKG